MSARADDVVSILAFGDSITAGYGLARDEAFPAVLTDMLDDEGYEIEMTNAGVSGETTSGGLARLEWVLDGIEQGPDICILELGANDGLQGLSVERMRDNLDAMLRILQKGDIRVLFCGMKAMPNLGLEYSESYNKAFPELAAKHNVAFMPFILSGVGGEPKLTQMDGLHPNAAGARAIARHIYPHVRKLVEAEIAQRP